MASNDVKLWEFVYFRKFKSAIFQQDYITRSNINDNNIVTTSNKFNECTCFNIYNKKTKKVCTKKESKHNWKGLYIKMHILTKKISNKKCICNIIGCQRTILKNKMTDHLKLHAAL